MELPHRREWAHFGSIISDIVSPTKCQHHQFPSDMSVIPKVQFKLFSVFRLCKQIKSHFLFSNSTRTEVNERTKSQFWKSNAMRYDDFPSSVFVLFVVDQWVKVQTVKTLLIKTMPHPQVPAQVNSKTPVNATVHEPAHNWMVDSTEKLDRKRFPMMCWVFQCNENARFCLLFRVMRIPLVGIFRWLTTIHVGAFREGLIHRIAYIFFGYSMVYFECLSNICKAVKNRIWTMTRSSWG